MKLSVRALKNKSKDFLTERIIIKLPNSLPQNAADAESISRISQIYRKKATKSY